MEEEEELKKMRLEMAYGLKSDANQLIISESAKVFQLTSLNLIFTDFNALVSYYIKIVRSIGDLTAPI